MKKILCLAAVGVMAVTSANAADFKGSGASFPYSVYQKWIKAYNKATGVKIDYISEGSGAGIKHIEARQSNFGGSDKPLTPRTLKKHGLYQFPSVVGAIVMAYNVPNVKHLRLSRAAIAEIALGHIKYWDNKLIEIANPKIKLPHKKLTFVHRSDASGTTFNFTYYLSKSNLEWRTHFGAKKSITWPGDHHVGGKGNPGVGALIKQTPYSVGYMDYADAKTNGIAMATVENREGYYIKPELKAFQASAAKANLDPRVDFYSVIADPMGKSSYPIVAATFILLPKEKPAMDKKVTAFFDWAYKNGADIASSLGYVPLPNALTNKIRAYWAAKGIK